MAEDREAKARARRAEHLRFVREIRQSCAERPQVHARLRRGLGKDVDQVPGMHEFVAHWLPEHRDRERERDRERDRAYYAVASLIADRPRHAVRELPADDAETGPVDQYGPSLGRTLAEAALDCPAGDRPRRLESTRRRLDLLVRQSPTGLHRYLPPAVRLLHRYETEPDWAQLLQDLADWPRYSAGIGRRWQQDYFRTLHREKWQKPDLDDAAQAVPEPGTPVP